ncbi:MAG: diadenylate cyclase CdaA [Cyclobacteriaceae bacterium]
MTLLFKIGFLDISYVDIFDILLVTVLLYNVYKLMRGSVAIRVFLGFLFIYLVYLVVNAVEMELLGNILGQFMQVGVIAVIILFQQEIRKFLLIIGKITVFDEGNFITSLKSIFVRQEDVHWKNITPIIEAMKTLGGSNTGALIVLSKNSELKFYAESGDRMDALISKRLLISIFNKYSPLHDGAVIIYEGKIIAARCILPVTEKDDLPAQFGLRHRAAIGMSEVTDSLVLVVSEETGQLSSVRNGYVYHNQSTQEMRKVINRYLSENEDNGEETEPASQESVLTKVKEEAKSAV